MQETGAKDFPNTSSLSGPEQLKELQKALEVWSKGSPLKPLLFEKVGSKELGWGASGELKFKFSHQDPESSSPSLNLSVIVL